MAGNRVRTPVEPMGSARSGQTQSGVLSAAGACAYRADRGGGLRYALRPVEDGQASRRVLCGGEGAEQPSYPCAAGTGTMVPVSTATSVS